MKLAVTILGYEIIAITLGDDTEYEEESDQDGIWAGETHNFERDPNPIDAQGEIPWSEYEDRGKGFGFHG